MLLIEANMFGVGYCAFRLGIDVEQVLHLVAIDDVLLDDFSRIAGLYLNIEGIVRDNLDDRSLLAETEATRTNHLHFVLQSRFDNRRMEILHDLLTL